jgi:hypothetical protein
MSINLKKQLNEAIAGGISDNKSVVDIANMHQAPIELIELMLRWGIEVEMEHTHDVDVAREIAMDHLTEDPIYYKKLKEMEGK